MPSTITSTSIEGRPASAKEITFVAGLVCVTLIGVDFRPPIISMGPLLGTLSARFALSHAEASLLTAIPDVLMGVLAVPAPRLARRYGRDRVILVALFLLLISTVARAFSGSAETLLLWTTLIGCGISVSGALIGGFIKATFPERAPQLIGIYAAALALGATLSAVLSAPIAVWAGWRVGIGMWFIPGFFAIAAWVYVERRQLRRAESATKTVYKLPVRRRKAWLIGLFYAADNFIYYALVSWIAPLYRERGVTETTAGLLLAVFTGTFLIANPIAGSFSRRNDRRLFLAGFSICTLAGLVALAISPQAAPLIVLPLISFGLGGGFTLGMTLPLDNTRDSDEANSWGAFMLLIAYVVASTGPLLLGILRDRTGGFTVPLWVLPLVGLLMLAITPLLHPEHPSHCLTE